MVVLRFLERGTAIGDVTPPIVVAGDPMLLLSVVVGDVNSIIKNNSLNAEIFGARPKKGEFGKCKEIFPSLKTSKNSLPTEIPGELE
jgi:hypothetical protein